MNKRMINCNMEKQQLGTNVNSYYKINGKEIYNVY